MVSTRSLAWTCLLVQLVLSCVCLIASLAVITAKLQSQSIYPERQYVSLEWWSFCFMSFLMIWATVFSMLGLSGHKKLLLFPHMTLLLIYCLFVGRVLLRVLLEFELSEFNWVIGVFVLTLAGSTIMFACTGQTIIVILLRCLNYTRSNITSLCFSFYIRTGNFAYVSCLLLGYSLKMMPPEPPARYLPVKRPLSIMIIIQLLVAVNMFAELSLVLTRDAEHFTNIVTRSAMAVHWWLSFIWLCTIFCSILVLFNNYFHLLLPHIIYTTFLSVLSFVSSFVLAVSNTQPWSLLYLCALSLLLTISIYYEISCYRQMRSALS